MNIIHTDTDLLLPSGYSEYEIDTDRDLVLTIRSEEDSDVFFRIKNVGKLKIRTFARRNSHVNYLFWNMSEKELIVDEEHNVHQDASVVVAYGECNGYPTKRNAYMALLGQNAYGTFSSASLVDCDKTYNLNVSNMAPHTYGDMKNYAVVLKNGNLLIDAVGKIVKGSYASESHQTSRALAFEEGQKAKILPELLIDENDVQASHAMSMGRVDEDQLYYLQSRGLSINQCISLISTGYLLPITETINNKELQDKLKEELGRKIEELC